MLVFRESYYVQQISVRFARSHIASQVG